MFALECGDGLVYGYAGREVGVKVYVCQQGSEEGLGELGVELAHGAVEMYHMGLYETGG